MKDLDYIESVKNFIIDNFLFGENFALGHDASLLENGIIDSTGVLELISFIEKTFGILVKDEELIPENLDSLNNINKFLKTKIS